MENKILKWVVIVVIFFTIAIIVPILINIILFNNSFVSNVSNDGWASFLGGYLGGIIGFGGVLVTIYNLKKENENTTKQYKLQIREEKKLEIVPYLDYKFEEAEMPESYESICIDLSFKSYNGNYINKAQMLNIVNNGLGGACDISLGIYMDEMDCIGYYNIAEIVPINSNGIKKTLVFSLPEIDVECKENICVDIMIVLFYKDLLSNQYVREMPGIINLDIVEDTYNYSFSYGKLGKYRTLFDETSYTLPYQHNENKEIEDFIRKNFNEYDTSPSPALECILQSYNILILETFENQLVDIALAMYKFPHMNTGMGDLVRFKKKSDSIWNIVCFGKRGVNEQYYIVYFVVIEFNSDKDIFTIADLKICSNKLSNNKWMNKKFERKVRKMARNLNKNF